MVALAETLLSLMASQMEQVAPVVGFTWDRELVAMVCGAAATTLTLLLQDGVSAAVASHMVLQQEVFCASRLWFDPSAPAMLSDGAVASAFVTQPPWVTVCVKGCSVDSSL